MVLKIHYMFIQNTALNAAVKRLRMCQQYTQNFKLGYYAVS